MKAAWLAPGVLLLGDFLQPEDCSRALEAAQGLTWTKAHLADYRDDRLIERRLNLEERDVEVVRLPFHFDEISPSFSCRVTQEICRWYRLPKLIVDQFVLSRYMPGCHIKPHSDTGVNSTSRIITCVQYLDGGFRGGELSFPDLNVRLAPNIGDLVLFFSEYRHSVSQVTEGVRHCLITFARTRAMLQLF